jgi:hypothetical protein
MREASGAWRKAWIGWRGQREGVRGSRAVALPAKSAVGRLGLCFVPALFGQQTAEIEPPVVATGIDRLAVGASSPARSPDL